MSHDQTGLLTPFRRDRKRDFASGSGGDLLASKVLQALMTNGATPRSSGVLPWRTAFGAGLELLRHQRNDAALAELARVHARELGGAAGGVGNLASQPLILILTDFGRLLAMILTPDTVSPVPQTEGAIVTERWVSVDDVAAHLGVAKDSVYRWIDSKSLPAHKIGKLWKFKLTEVDEWVRGGGAMAAATSRRTPSAKRTRRKKR